MAQAQAQDQDRALASRGDIQQHKVLVFFPIQHSLGLGLVTRRDGGQCVCPVLCLCLCTEHGVRSTEYVDCVSEYYGAETNRAEPELTEEWWCV